jgi:hypothetical protein
VSLEDLFKVGGPTPHMCWTKCKVCGMGSLGGIDWYRRHECPEPFPPESAQTVWDSVVGSRIPVSPTMKARLQMSWRFGYAKPR